MCDRNANATLSLATTAHDLVRALLGVVLLVASGLKGHQLATGPLPDAGFLNSRWFIIVLVESELCFALWLLAGRARKLTWYAAVVCFSAFACVSAYKGIAGEVSCGCFGKLAVNPWYTFGLDIAAVVLLLVFPPRATEWRIGRALALPAWLAIVLALVVGVSGAVAMASFRAASVFADGQMEAEGSLVMLLPEEWDGKPFPLAGYIDVGERFRTGHWILVLYRLGCPKCEELIEWFRTARAANDAAVGNRPAVAFVEVPESGRSAHELPLPSGACLLGKLDGSREWFVSTPAVLMLKDGIVEQVCREQSVAGLRRMLEGNRLTQREI